jgi:UDP-N-acetylglucosamine 2-epimerase (non-hydrolysing)
MKILTILGTRPEIIRLSQVIKKLDQYGEHILVHTGQNYDKNLSDIFFRDLKIREPDYYLGVKAASFGEQVGNIIRSCEKILEEEKPDRLLILGDTNSSLSAFVAKRLGIQVYHMEAGNRCYDDRVPEEINRRVIDHCSDICMPYTERSRMNLLREGIAGEKIFVIGNPIYEVILKYKDIIDTSSIHDHLKLAKKEYFLVTCHRSENVDNKVRLRSILEGLSRVNKEFDLPVIISIHPHTRNRITEFGIHINDENMRFCDPFGLIDFISLEMNAKCVLSDSGTVQEECCIFKVPNVTLRDVTERPETIECGSGILSGADPDRIFKAVQNVIQGEHNWTAPPEYLRENVSATVVKILQGFNDSK